MYQMYQAQSDMMAPVRAMAVFAGVAFKGPALGPFTSYLSRNVVAASELIARAGLTHKRPPFGIDSVMVGTKEVEVREEAAYATPFGTLLHFKKNIDVPQPRVLIVAPLSGHFATLLRGTVRTMLGEHDVFVTDWHNARDVRLADGRFGTDEYIDHLVRFLQEIGPGAHVVAVCQPCVPALAAVAVMAEAANPALPRSMTLMAGPVDARINPTKVNELAVGKSLEWFEQNLISRVPQRYRGACRRVYPGFLQLTSFTSMNLDRHVKAHLDLFQYVIDGNDEKADATRQFYDEYFAVLDLPAEFYLETVRTIFQEYALARGNFEWHGHRVDPRAITRTALLTVEGEKDDICGVGQTLAAQDLCSALRPHLRRHHHQAGVGHFGVFSGIRWNNQIYPAIKNMILSAD